MQMGLILRIVRNVALCALVIPGAGLACRGRGADQGGELPRKVVIGYQAIPNAEIVAKDKGWVEAALGVPVEWLQFSSGTEVNLAIESGSVDLGLGGNCSSAIAVARGMNVEVICIHDIIGDNEALVVRRNVNLNTVKDLVGKKVGVPFGSTTHYHLMVALRLANVDPATVEILDMNCSDVLVAFKRGDLDAGYVWEPTLSQMVAADGQVLVSSRELAQQGFLTCDLGLARKEFAAQYPDLVVKYLQAQLRAIDLCRDHPEAAAEAIAHQFSIDRDLAALQIKSLIILSGEEQLSDQYLGKPGAIGHMADVLKDTAVFMVAQKAIPETPALEVFRGAINPAYLQRAMAEAPGR